MAKFLNNLDRAFHSLANFLKFFEKFLHEKFLGFEIFYLFEAMMLVVLIMLLYLLISAKIGRSVKKFQELEDKFEQFKEDLNLQIASIKIQKITPGSGSAASKETVINEMLDSVRKEPKIDYKEEDTGVREIPKQEDFFENTEEKDRAAIAAPEKVDPEINEQNFSAATEAKKDDAKEIGELFHGLDDVSNPFGMPGIEKEKDPKPENREVPAGNSVLKAVVGDASIGWDEKTALKNNGEIKDETANEEVVLGISDLVELPDAPEKADDEAQEIDEPDRTKIDRIDQNIDVGSQEISIRIDEEPRKTIDGDGLVEERRISERIDQNLDVEMVFDGFTDFIKECSLNISKGGMFVKTPSPKPVGSKISLNIRLKDGYKLIKGEGEVIRVEKIGMGIKFLSLDKESQILADRIVEQRKP